MTTTDTDMFDAIRHIRSWLPPNTYETGHETLGVAAKWMWTTPDGKWRMALAKPLIGTPTIAMKGPGGSHWFAGCDRPTVERMRRLLVVVGAIEDVTS